MKLQLASDLHLEFSSISLKNEGSDILVLSGDICVAEYFLKSEASPYFGKAQQFRQFFHEVSNEWNRVFYVLGNHEHYKGDFDATVNIIRDQLSAFPNITVLDNDYVDMDGIRFIGGTLWTSITSPVDEAAVQYGLNDFRLIQRSKRDYRKFRVSDANFEHLKTLSFIDENSRQKTVVLTHHAPSWQSVTPAFIGDRLNPAYVTNLDNWILDRPWIKLWTHGHVHSSHDYMIGDTRIVANPRGYNGENRDFQPGKIIEI